MPGSPVHGGGPGVGPAIAWVRRCAAGTGAAAGAEHAADDRQRDQRSGGEEAAGRGSCRHVQSLQENSTEAVTGPQAAAGEIVEDRREGVQRPGVSQVQADHAPGAHRARRYAGSRPRRGR